MKSPLGFEMDCPKCPRQLIYVGSNGDTHLLFCLIHGMAFLPADGRLVLESDLVRQAQEKQAPAEKDVSAEIKALLPKELTAKLDEAENVLAKSAAFLEVESIEGDAASGVSPEGKIWVLPSSKKDMGIVGEEIMHLHRWTSGFPRMNPEQAAADGRYASGVKLISGHFEELAFYRFLEDLKLNPRGAVNAAMPKTARMLTTIRHIVKDDGETDEWRVRLSGMFAQASLLTSENEGSAVLKAFEDEVYQPYAKIGQLVCDEIVAARDKDKNGVKEHLERTLFTHLKLPKESVSVKPIF